MDLPSHALWTFAVEKIFWPDFFKTHHPFLFFSLLFAILPDLIHDVPYTILVLINKNKLGLKGIKSVIHFAYDVNRNQPLKYQALFPQVARLGFFSHSFITFLLAAIMLNLIYPPLFWPFVVGYGSHLLVDVPLHNDYFSSKPLYPFHQLTIPGIITWYNTKNFQKYNYTALIAVFLLLILFNRGFK